MIEKMIESSGRLVYDVARKLYQQNPNYELEDLAQCGFMELTKNHEKFDPDRGAETTFVYHCVKNAMLREMKISKRKSADTYLSEDVSYSHGYFDPCEYVKIKSEDEKNVVTLLYEGYNRREIAEKLSMSMPKLLKIIKTVGDRIKVDAKEEDFISNRGYIS